MVRMITKKEVPGKIVGNLFFKVPTSKELHQLLIKVKLLYHGAGLLKNKDKTAY